MLDKDDLANLAGISQRNQINQKLDRMEQQRRGVGACPHCGGGLPKLGVSVCMHCRKKLVWHKNVVGKPGQEALCKSGYDKNQALAGAIAGAKLERMRNAQVWMLPAFFLYIPFLLYCWFTTSTFFDFFGELMLVGYFNLGFFPLSGLIGMAWMFIAVAAPFNWLAVAYPGTGTPVAKGSFGSFTPKKDPRPRCSSCGKNKFGAKTCLHCGGA